MYAPDDGEDLGRVEVLSQSCEMSRVKELTFRNSVFSQQKLTENSQEWLSLGQQSVHQDVFEIQRYFEIQELFRFFSEGNFQNCKKCENCQDCQN